MIDVRADGMTHKQINKKIIKKKKLQYNNNKKKRKTMNQIYY